MSRIVCVGSLNMDIAAYCAALPRPGETVLGSSLVSSPGGKGLNQAVAACRLGANVAFAGCLGTDQVGDTITAFLVSTLAACNVELALTLEEEMPARFKRSSSRTGN